MGASVDVLQLRSALAYGSGSVWSSLPSSISERAHPTTAPDQSSIVIPVTQARRRQTVPRSEKGQALIEYALIISLIALVAIVALQTTGTNISSILHKIVGDV